MRAKQTTNQQHHCQLQPDQSERGAQQLGFMATSPAQGPINLDPVCDGKGGATESPGSAPFLAGSASCTVWGEHSSPWVQEFVYQPHLCFTSQIAKKKKKIKII